MEENKKHGLRLKLSNFFLASESASLPEHFVDKNGVRDDPDKIQAILNASITISKTELRRCLWLEDYYRRFASLFVDMSSAFYAGTSVKVSFHCNTKMLEPFELIDEKLTVYPGLAFCVQTDASGRSMGAVLAQSKEDGKIYSMYYAKWTLNHPEEN